MNYKSSKLFCRKENDVKRKRNRICYFLLSIFSISYLLPCHIPTFLYTHSTCLGALSTLFHSVLQLFTFHSTCLTHICAHIAYLFYIFTSSWHKARCHHTHIHTVAHYHNTSCSHAYVLLIHKTGCTTGLAGFTTVIASVYACLVFWVLKFGCFSTTTHFITTNKPIVYMSMQK